MITETELNVIAALAIIGLSNKPKNGYSTPAAIGSRTLQAIGEISVNAIAGYLQRNELDWDRPPPAVPDRRYRRNYGQMRYQSKARTRV